VRAPEKPVSPAKNAPDTDRPTTVRVSVPADAPMVDLLGPRDRLLRQVEEAFGCVIVARGNELTITGIPAEVEHVRRLFRELAEMVRKGQDIDEPVARQAIRMILQDEPKAPSDVFGETLLTHRGRSVRPKTIGQKNYLDAIRSHTVTFGIGPAGTGKTYLAMAMAVTALKTKQVNRLILTRPAVEAGERLGFLPGTLSEKIDPYLRPLWDALRDMMDVEELVQRVEDGSIEVAPLAYMRGRTLNDAFIVLDEAQNTTAEQMKMFLTRIGFGSKAVVTGDVSQVDLPSGRRSGLRVVQGILDGIEGVAFEHLQPEDVVRHHIVQRIVEAYAVWDETQLEITTEGLR
jgi:phosphate starvation-inducible PhoH-like protein